jgi:tRNA nucleotidyltransferase (CCA-adding enzyme)
MDKIAKQKGYAKPYICGGLPRDKVLNRIERVVDLDLTTGNKDIHSLAQDTANILKLPLKVLPDTHSQLHIPDLDLKIDFSSNFVIPIINQIFNKNNFHPKSPMYYELYSRDFTCNTLLLGLDLKTILDPTGLGLLDIKNKLIKTCLPAPITLGYDNKRIVRAIYLASKLNFNIDQEILNFVKKYPHLIANCKEKYLSKKLKQSFQYNREKTSQFLTQLNLWKYIPTTPELIEFHVNK